MFQIEVKLFLDFKGIKGYLVCIGESCQYRSAMTSLNNEGRKRGLNGLQLLLLMFLCNFAGGSKQAS